MLRRNDPILIDGVDIVQHTPSERPAATLWTSLQRTPLFGKLLPR
jgi:hypothetical protein